MGLYSSSIFSSVSAVVCGLSNLLMLKDPFSMVPVWHNVCGLSNFAFMAFHIGKLIHMAFDSSYIIFYFLQMFCGYEDYAHTIRNTLMRGF